MVKKICLFSLSILPMLLKAQLVINAQLPPAGLVQKDQLWNLVLTNNKEMALSVTLQMSLQDASTGQVVLSASSGGVVLPKGVRVITAKDIQPLFYNYNSPDITGDYLSMGTYMACYRVINNSPGEMVEELGQDCIHFNIDPLGPPLLNAPNDKAQLQNPYPEFTWMPPAPFEMFTRLSYELFVTEVLPGQSPAEAIQYNAPVYSKTNISQPYDLYPASFTKLDTGKVYAWQVVAKNGINYAAKTEVWTFTIKKTNGPEDILSLTPFVKLRTANPDKGIAPNGILKIAYNNKNADKSARIEVLEYDSKEKPASFEINLIQGENNIQFDLRKIMRPEENKLYLAKLVNGQNETWFVQFVVKNYK